MKRTVGPFEFEDSAIDEDTARFQNTKGQWVVARRERTGIETVNYIDAAKDTLVSTMKFVEGCCEACLRCATDGVRAVFYCQDGRCRCHSDEEAPTK